MSASGVTRKGNMSNAVSTAWKEPFEIRPRTRHEDARGSLFEVLRFGDEEIPPGGQLYTFSVEPGQRRGDHYHLRKREWFTCVFGEAILLLSSESGEARRVHLTAKDPVIVYSAPKTAHAFINDKDTPAIIVSYGSKQHDPADNDTVLRSAGE